MTVKSQAEVRRKAAADKAKAKAEAKAEAEANPGMAQ